MRARTRVPSSLLLLLLDSSQRPVLLVPPSLTFRGPDCLGHRRLPRPTPFINQTIRSGVRETKPPLVNQPAPPSTPGGRHPGMEGGQSMSHSLTHSLTGTLTSQMLCSSLAASSTVAASFLLTADPAPAAVIAEAGRFLPPPPAPPDDEIDPVSMLASWAEAEDLLGP